MRPLTLGTAGHIDHGKTALVEALTGKNTDRLEEERRRGISIELGYARLELGDGRSLSVIDVPGHERLVRTMVAGATGIDLFLMVIAADEGVMPQTREHLTVLRALEVPVGVVALSRCDLADPGTREAAAATARELIGAPLVEVSARTGQGLDLLRAELANAAGRAEKAGAPRDGDEPAVLHVDRVFTLHGAGTIATGTLWSGEMARGERVEVHPAGVELRIRSIQVHDRDLDRAAPGQRVALNLTGRDRGRLERGDVLASPGSGLAPSYRLDVALEPHLGPIEPAGRIVVHHGTRRAQARVVPLGGEFAQLRLSSPLIARAGDRVVLRSTSPPGTLGGAAVIDPVPARHGPGTPARRLRAMLEGRPEEPVATADQSGNGAGGPVEEEPMAAERESQLDEHALRALALLRADGVGPRAPAAIADQLGCGLPEAKRALESLAAQGEAIRVKPGVYYAAATLDALESRLVEAATERDGAITLAEARDLLGTSRKYAQALLEHLDGSHVMVRRGDRHVLRRSARRRARA